MKKGVNWKQQFIFPIVAWVAVDCITAAWALATNVIFLGKADVVAVAFALL
jgi:hypothetical protein